MKSPIRLALAIAAISLIAAPAMAQEVIGTLTVNQGSIMTSTGGEFASASSGEAIQVGEQIMVAEGASASVTFSNGVVTNFAVPGVHTISGLPAAGTGAEVGTTAGSSVAATAAVIVGTAIATTIMVEEANDDAAPDSPASR